MNRSLSFLEQVIVAMNDSGRQHVPFRQSKLTHFLRDSLGIHIHNYSRTDYRIELPQNRIVNPRLRACAAEGYCSRSVCVCVCVCVCACVLPTCIYTHTL